jgi:hypothetical protein
MFCFRQVQVHAKIESQWIGACNESARGTEQARKHFIAAADMQRDEPGFWLEREETELSGPAMRDRLLGLVNPCPRTVAQARYSGSVGTGDKCETNLS